MTAVNCCGQQCRPAASPGRAEHVRKASNVRRINAMNAPLKAVESSARLETTLRDLGRAARQAARALALAPASQKNRALAAMAKAIRDARSAILAANAEDVSQAKSAGATAAFLDRLT